MPRMNLGVAGDTPIIEDSTFAANSRLAGASRSRQDLAALFIYALLSVAATWPTVLRFGSQALGEHYFDRTQNIWNAWWVKVALLDLHTNPFHTNLLLYPTGADLYFHTLNLPSTLMALPVEVIGGPVAAYNFSMMLALTLSGYGGYRLARYLTGSLPAALVAGIIFGFSTIALFELRGHTQTVSMQWLPLTIEFYLRAWNGPSEGATPSRTRLYAVLTGVFFALALLTVGYYEVQLLLFFLVHIVWWLLHRRGASWRARFTTLLVRARPLLTWGLGTAVILAAPYLLGAWNSLQSGQVVPETADDLGRAVSDSVDLLSFIVPSRNHWLLGAQLPWWSGIDLSIHDWAYLGVVTVVLAALGVRFLKLPRASLWLAVIVLNMLLALGPALRVNGHEWPVPLPFALLEHVPVISLVRAPERFMIAVYLALSVLSAYGVVWLLQRIGAAVVPRRLRRLSVPVVTGGVVALLLLEMPLHQQYTEALPASPTITALAQQPTQGAVLELPLTQHGWVDTNRMAYQIIDGRPITSGFLSRPVVDPYVQACSPLRPFTLGVKAGQADILPMLDANAELALLRQNGFTNILVYKQEFITPEGLSPVSTGLEAQLQSTAQSFGTELADDNLATLYTLRSTSSSPLQYMELGDGWHDPETSYGQPFRWVDGSQADLCVYNPSPVKASLNFNVTSFSTPRHLQLRTGGNVVYDAQVAADGALHTLSTPAIDWPAGPQLVQIMVPEGSISPASLGKGADSRQLSLGFGPIKLEPAQP